MVRVLGLVPSTLDTSPGQRYRIEQWRPYLERHGVIVSLEPFGTEELGAMLREEGHYAKKASLVTQALARRVRVLRESAREFDCVYIFREASLVGPALERWLVRLGVRYVFDFDDAIFLGYRSPANGYLSLLKNPTRTRVSCRLAAHVMAGNRYLAEYALRHNANVSVVPTTMDLAKYRVPTRQDAPSARRPVIGWTGTHSTAQHLKGIAPALRRLARESDFELLVIGVPDFTLEGVNVRTIPWRSESEATDLWQIDVGIMPLPDERWTRGKCGAKLLQYMAVGLPTVASPVGVNTEIVDHGANGMLATTEHEWVLHLRELMRSEELRDRLGRAGRRTVEERFDGETHAAQVASIFRTVAEGSHGSRSDRPASRS